MIVHMEYFDSNLPILQNFEKTILVNKFDELPLSLLRLNNFLKV